MPRRNHMRWCELHPRLPVTPQAANQAVQALASLSGHPRVALEAHGHDGRVGWLMGAEEHVLLRALAAMGPHLAGLRISEPRESRQPSTVAAAIRLPGHRAAQLDTAKTEVAARSILAALAGARGTEQLRLQVVLGPRHRPRPAGEVPAQVRRPMAAKLGEHRFSCEVRISAHAATTDRARSLVQGVVAGLRPLEAAGVALHLRRASTHSVDAVTDPFLWPLELGVSEVVSLLGWPISSKDEDLPGVPSAHPQLLPPSTRLPSIGRIIGVSPVEHNRTVAQGMDEALRATHVMGPMGVGKSVLMTNLALADAEAGRAIVIVDGKGDSLIDFTERLNPARHGDVVWFDQAGSTSVGVNAFPGDPERDADVLFGVVKDLYGGELGPRSSNLLHAALVTLARVGNCSLAQLPHLLSNDHFRRSIVAKVAPADPMGLGSHWAWFNDLSDAERLQVVAPLRNKLDPVLSLRPGLRAMFGQSKPAFSFSDLFMNPAKRPIVLISLGAGELGPEGARVLGSVLLALIWQAAQARVHVPQSQRHPVSIFLDEFQEIARIGDLGDALGRARGLGVAFTLAHQALGQLSPAMKDAVISQPRSRICFQLNHKDAREIAATTNGVLEPRDFQELPAFHAYASLLVGGDRAPWCSLLTRPLPDKRQSAHVVRERSRVLYGRPIAEVERELLTTIGFEASGNDETFGRGRRSGGAQ